MAKRVHIDIVSRFLRDRQFLPYDDNEIARKMGKTRSSFSRSINEGPITTQFLRQFYSAFADELNEINGQLSSEGKVHIESIGIVIKKNELREKIKIAESLYEEVKESNERILASIDRLEKRMDKVITQKLLEIQKQNL